MTPTKLGGLVFVFLSLLSCQQQTERQLPFRLLDGEDFKQEITDNIVRPGKEIHEVVFPSTSWSVLGKAASSEDVFWYTSYPDSFDLSFLRAVSPGSLFFRDTSRIIPFVLDFTHALSIDGPVLTLPNDQAISIKKSFARPGEVLNLNFRSHFPDVHFTLTALPFDQNLPTGAANEITVTWKIDGKKVSTSALKTMNRASFSKDLQQYTARAHIEPGLHNLAITFDNVNYDRLRFTGRLMYVERLHIGVIPKSSEKILLYKQPKDGIAPGSEGDLTGGFPVPDAYRKQALRTTEIYNYGMDYLPRINPVFTMELPVNEAFSEAARAVYMLAPSTASTKVALPDNAAMSLRYGFFNKATSFSPATLTLNILDTNTSSSLERRVFQVANSFPFRWHKKKIDLTRHSGADVTIQLEYATQNGELSSLLIGEPVIYSQAQTSDRPNVILISLDTLRADHLSGNGYSRRTSPNLDHIASGGIQFTNAHSNSCWTTNSHHAMLTGYYPLTHSYISGSYDDPRIPRKMPTLAGYLQEAGYRTVAFTGGGSISARYGFAKGFDSYSQSRKPHATIRTAKGNRIISQTGFDRVYPWLEENYTTQPFFLFLHTYAVHTPYATPPEYDSLFTNATASELPIAITNEVLSEVAHLWKLKGQPVPQQDLDHIISAYDRGIKYIDDEVQVLDDMLSELGLVENTILIITSDHGEEFYEHGNFGHIRLYEESVRVPLIIRYPARFKKHTKINSAVQVVDIVPTILDLVGVQPRFRLHGESLVPLIETHDRPAKGRSGLFAAYKNSYSITRAGQKYYIGLEGEEEVFDLRRDPGESHNVLRGGEETSRFRDLFLAMLYTVADSMAGWNIIVDSRTRDAEVEVILEDFSVADSVLARKNWLFSKEGLSNIKIGVGRFRYAGKRAPFLMNFAGTYRDSFTLRMTTRREPAGSVEMKDIHISRRSADDYSRISAGDLLQRAGVKGRLVTIIYNDLFGSSEVSGVEGRMSKELVDQLRALGYI